MRISIPVSPYIATIDGVDNVVLSLLGLVHPKYLRFPPRPTKPTGDRFSFRSQHVDAKSLVDLGMTGAVTFSMKFTSTVIYFLSSMTSEQEIDNDDDTSVITSATFAVGLRIGVFATDVDANVNLSITTVASKAELNQASTSYQVSVLGAGLEAIGIIRPLIANSTGPFTAQTLQTIGAIQGSFDMLLAKEGADLTPAITDVTIDTDRVAAALPINSGDRPKLAAFEKSCIFALERAFRYKTADSAAEDAPSRGEDPDIVRLAYDKVLGLRGDAPVTPQARQRATTILNAGRF